MEKLKKGSDLEAAIQEFMDAGKKYREFLKRNYPERLKAIVWAIDEETNQVVCYAESERWMHKLCNATWDQFKDDFTFDRIEEAQEEE